MFGRLKANEWTATLTETGWSAAGRSKEEAMDNLRQKLTLLENRLTVFKHIRVPEKNATFVLTYDGCWIYRICHDNGLESSCMMGEQSYGSAIEQMMRHVREYATC